MTAMFGWQQIMITHHDLTEASRDLRKFKKHFSGLEVHKVTIITERIK